MDLRALQRFEIRELCYFVALAEELHFGRAATRVGINQSPLSKSITLLEHRLKIKLFLRNRRRTSLTEAGVALLPQAQAILREVAHARRDIFALATGRKGRLRIGFTDGVSLGRFARIMEQSRKEDRELDFSIEEMPPSAQIRALRHDRLDIALTVSAESDPLHGDPELESIPLRSDAMCVVMRSDHALTQERVLVSLDSLPGAFFMVGEDRLRSSSAEVSSGSQPPWGRVIQYVASQGLLLAHVLMGNGIGLVGAEQVDMCLAVGLVCRPIEASIGQLTTYLIRRREGVSAVVTRFVERARRLY